MDNINEHKNKYTMQKLTHTQNLIILVALENFLADCKNRDVHSIKQIEELVELYEQKTFNIK